MRKPAAAPIISSISYMSVEQIAQNPILQIPVCQRRPSGVAGSAQTDSRHSFDRAGCWSSPAGVDHVSVDHFPTQGD